MDPFRYHDTNEIAAGVCRDSPTLLDIHEDLFQEFQNSICIPEVCSPAMPGSYIQSNKFGILTSRVQRTPSLPRSILGSSIRELPSDDMAPQSAPPQSCFMWEKLGDTTFEPSLSSNASSPSNSVPRSFSSSPPISESNFSRRSTFSRASSVTEQPSNGLVSCSLCKKNGERPQIYNSHQLHCFHDGRVRVECPILRNVRCTICGATGDDAHTLTHCPFSRKRIAIAVAVKNTPRSSTGHRKRKN